MYNYCIHIYIYTRSNKCDDDDDNYNDDELSLEVYAPNAAALPPQKQTSSVAVIGRECIPQSRFLDTYDPSPPHCPVQKKRRDVQKTYVELPSSKSPVIFSKPTMCTWVCLKIGYIPNYSHLIGIMIINHWV